MPNPQLRRYELYALPGKAGQICFRIASDQFDRTHSSLVVRTLVNRWSAQLRYAIALKDFIGGFGEIDERSELLLAAKGFLRIVHRRDLGHVSREHLSEGRPTSLSLN